MAGQKSAEALKSCAGLRAIPPFEEPSSGYKMTELGPLPEDWEVVNLEEIMTPVVRTDRRIIVEDDKEYTLLSVSLYAKGVKIKERVLGKNLKTKTWFRVERDDFLLLKIWARRGAYGFLREDVPNAIVSSDYPILRINHTKAYRDFIELYLSQPSIWSRLEVGAGGSTSRRRVHERQFLALLSVPLPPLPEQRAIVNILRTVQRAKEATDGVIAALRELKKSLMRYLFTYGPVPVDQADQVALRETEIGPLPEGWEIMPLRRLGQISAGGSAPQGSHYFGGTHPFVRVQHLDEDGYEVRRWDLITDEAVQRYRLRLFPPGTIVFPKSGASIRLEKRAILASPSYLVSHLCAIIPNYDIVNGDFLFFALKRIPLAAEKAEGYPTLSLTEIGQRLVPLPPLSEQRAIAEILRAVDRKMEAEEARRRALEALFRTLLHDLMTARLRLPQAFITRFAEDAP